MFEDILGKEDTTPTKTVYYYSEFVALIELLKEELEDLYNKNAYLEHRIDKQTKEIEILQCKIYAKCPEMTLKSAREFIYSAFINDHDLLRAYVDNISMLLYDEQKWSENGWLDFTQESLRDRVAANIMGLIFGDEPKSFSKKRKLKAPPIGAVEVDA